MGDGDPGLSKLAEWADQNEGVLTARLLQRMADALGRDGKRRSWGIASTPAVANSYVLQVMQTSFPSLGGRNQRELLTLAEALDRMALGDYGRAADVLSQLFKAIEMALHDGEWSRASHVEILPQTGRPLLSRQEEALVARDIREEVRIKAHLDKAGVVAGRGAAGVRTGSPHDRQPADKTKDKGRSKHGKGKDRAKHERKKQVVILRLLESLPARISNMSQVSSLASWVARTRFLILACPLLWEFRVRVVAASQAATGLHQWRYALRRFGQVATMAELIEGVTLAVEARASPMGSFLSVFHRVVPTTGPLRDLFPLSIAGVHHQPDPDQLLSSTVAWRRSFSSAGWPPLPHHAAGP